MERQRHVMVCSLRYSVSAARLLTKLSHGLDFEFWFEFVFKFVFESKFLILDTKRWLRKETVVGRISSHDHYKSSEN